MRTTEDILSLYESPIRERVTRLSGLIKHIVPGIQEMPDEKSSVIGYGFGLDYQDMICTILLSQKGVKLGFYRGTEIPDQRRMLKGTGRVHRYLDVEDDLKDEVIIEYLNYAMQNHTKRTGKIN